MASRITIDPAVLDEAIKAVEKERAQLKSDAGRTLKIVKGETSESANGSDFVSSFTETADALVKKADNILQELKNYSDSIEYTKEVLTGADRDADDGIRRSNVSGH